MGNSNCDTCGHDTSMCICPKQIGGQHYAATYQHWDLCFDCQVPYLESCATKYVSRWWKKGGFQDLEKAESYLLKLIEKLNAGHVSMSSDFNCEESSHYDADEAFGFWVESASIPTEEAAICLEILEWNTVDDIAAVAARIRRHRQLASTKGALHPLAPYPTTND